MRHCGSCKHYFPLLNQDAVAPGECRRFPPQISKFFIPNTLHFDVAYPPLPKDHIACGEFVEAITL